MSIDVVPVSDSDFMWSGERLRPGVMYLVSWRGRRGSHIVKAGVSDYPARWRKFVAKGAEIHGLWRGEGHVSLEAAVHKMLSAAYPAAFTEKGEAVRYLGTLGGWTECHAVPAVEMESMLEEVRFGLVQSG